MEYCAPRRRLQVTCDHLFASPIAPNPVASQKKFVYTKDGSILTPEQREHYETYGYIVIRKLIPDEDIDRYRQHFLDICSEKIERVPTMTVMRDVSLRNRPDVPQGEAGITKIQDWQDDPVLFKYCETPSVIDYVEAFCGQDIKTIHTMVINKPPHVGKTGRHPLHQDLLYFPFRPADDIVAVWTAMQKVDRNNGCLVVVPGSHKSGVLRNHGYPDWNEEGGANKAYLGITDLLDEEFEGRIHLPMEKGDTVFFHPLLIHGSGYNRTSGYRKSISCHYAASTCDYIDYEGTPHEIVAHEIEEIVMKKSGLSVKYQDVWRMKSRLVRGKASTL